MPQLQSLERCLAYSICSINIGLKELVPPSPYQGDIYVLSSLDREKKDHYILTALAKDNPGDIASNRRENSVQVRATSPAQGPPKDWNCGGSKQHF